MRLFVQYSLCCAPLTPLSGTVPMLQPQLCLSAVQHKTSHQLRNCTQVEYYNMFCFMILPPSFHNTRHCKYNIYNHVFCIVMLGWPPTAYQCTNSPQTECCSFNLSFSMQNLQELCTFKTYKSIKCYDEGNISPESTSE